MTTTDDLLDLVGIGQRASTIRFDVLDTDLVHVGTLNPDMGGTDVPLVVNNANRTIKRTLERMRLSAMDRLDFDPIAHRVRPVWVLENGAEFPLGVFILADVNRERDEWGLDGVVSGVDQLFILDQAVDHSVAYGAGVEVRAAIEALLNEARVPSFAIDPTITATIASPVAWPAGTRFLEVVNDLAALGGAYSAFADNAGVLRVRRFDSPDVTDTPLVYERGGRIYRGSMLETDDLLSAPNRYIVIDSSNPDEPIVGRYDVPPESPISEARRGFVVATTIEEQGLESETQANERARGAYLQARHGYEWVSFSGPPDPRHDTWDVVQYLGVKYREQAWTLPLAEGAEMRHELRRTYDRTETEDTPA